MTIALFFLSAMTLYYAGAMIFLWRGLRRLRPPAQPQDCNCSVNYSVVIAARNEEESIGRCLESVFNQHLPRKRYEVIVVNDRSSDRTAAVCETYLRRFPALTLLTVSKTPPGVAPKKHAVMTGIAQARNEIIVLTDADCIVPPDWLAAIDRNFTETTGLVQGITVHRPVSGSHHCFRGLQAMDFLSHGIVAAAGIGAHLPLNSNANNLAFRKKAFLEVGGYGSMSRKVVSGDDDLLVQRIAKCGRWGVSFMLDPAGAVTTRPALTCREIFEQRKRWGSKTVNYAPAQVVFLSGIFLFYCGIVLSCAEGFFRPMFFMVFSAMFVIKILGEYLLLVPGTALFNQKQLRPYIVPASLLQLPVVLAAVVGGVFGRFWWKGERFGRAVA